VRHPSLPRRPSRSPDPLVHRLQTSLARFLHVEAAGGVVLLIAAVLALVWANSPASGAYARLWHTPVTIGVGDATFERPLEFWVNDGLMTIFFLVVGLEIRSEIRHGALASPRAALLPVIAALGGMLVPALLFLAIDHSATLGRGWAIPTATDIAFAVGILALLGPRVPRPLRAFLLALAIIDDIGAVIIIAAFYSHGVELSGLAIAAAAVAAVLVLARLGARSAFIPAAAGIAIWYGLLRSGVHPTLAGVVLAFLIPGAPAPGATHRLAPCERLERALHPWVAYGVMPLFALANAGIAFRGIALDAAEPRRLVLGIALALLVGKPLGIALAALASSGVRRGALPRGLRRGGILLVGSLGGIGFTMSIFIAGLAFEAEPLLGAAKLGILVGSACAALLGLAVGHLMLRASRGP
jgi:Na+:H+ antiporter, NhaA family